MQNFPWSGFNTLFKIIAHDKILQFCGQKQKLPVYSMLNVFKLFNVAVIVFVSLPLKLSFFSLVIYALLPVLQTNKDDILHRPTDDLIRSVLPFWATLCARRCERQTARASMCAELSGRRAVHFAVYVRSQSSSSSSSFEFGAAALSFIKMKRLTSHLAERRVDCG